MTPAAVALALAALTEAASPSAAPPAGGAEPAPVAQAVAPRPDFVVRIAVISARPWTMGTTKSGRGATA